MQGLHDRVFAVDKFFIWIDLAPFVGFKTGVKLRDFLAVGAGEFSALVAQGFAQGVVDLGGVDELDFPLAFGAFVFG